MMIFDVNFKEAVDKKYYAKFFQANDNAEENIRKCYFYVAKELINDRDVNKSIENLFNEKYNFETYMKNEINIVYFSPKEEDKNIFINSLKEDFILENLPNLINIQKY